MRFKQYQQGFTEILILPTVSIKTKLLTHPLSAISNKTPNLLKINVYKFRYKNRVKNIMQLVHHISADVL